MAVTWPFPPLNWRADPSRTTATFAAFMWTPVGGCGYRFAVDGTVTSHTWDETAAQTRFRRPDANHHVYEIEPILIGPGEKVTA